MEAEKGKAGSRQDWMLLVQTLNLATLYLASGAAAAASVLFIVDSLPQFLLLIACRVSISWNSSVSCLQLSWVGYGGMVQHPGITTYGLHTHLHVIASLGFLRRHLSLPYIAWPQQLSKVLAEASMSSIALLLSFACRTSGTWATSRSVSSLRFSPCLVK